MLKEAESWWAATKCQTNGPSAAELRMECLPGSPSLWPAELLMKLISTCRWQSGLALIWASVMLLLKTGLETEQGVPMGALKLSRVRLEIICSKAPKINILSLTMGPPRVPPNCSRWKSLSDLPSEVFEAKPSSRWKWKALPCTSLVPDLVMMLTTPPAVRPNSGLAPLATT